jgi:iron complex outermembrane receptor protein
MIPIQTAAPQAGATAAALLRRAPGVYISQHSGEGKAQQIFLRGYDAGHGQDIEIHAGGIPVNEVSHIHGQGYADLHFLMPEIVTRMRVLEGAHDPRQGDFAVAGSIDFDLGMQNRGVLARASLGRFGNQRALLAWAPRDQSEQTFVAAELSKGDGFGPSRGWRRGSAVGQILLKLSSTWKLRFLASSYASRFDSAGVLREDALARGDVGFFDAHVNGQGGFSARHQVLSELRFQRRKEAASLSTYLVWRELTLRHNFTGSLLDDAGDGLLQQNDSLTIGARARYRRKMRVFKKRLKLELGVRFRHDRIDQRQQRRRLVDQVPYATDIDAKLAITDLALYGDIDLRLSSRFKLRGGLRAEALSYQIEDRIAKDGSLPQRDAFGFFIGPKLTLEAMIVSSDAVSMRAFLSYGRGFRSPNALSLGQGERAPFVEVDSGELGVRFRLPLSLYITTSGFLTYVKDELVFDHSVGRNLHAGAALRGGVAWMLRFRPLAWVQLISSGTWSRAQRDDGSELPYAPRLVLRSELELDRRVATLFGKPLRVFMSLAWTTLGSRPLPYSQTSEPIHLLEGTLGASSHGVSLAIQGYNLTDARWRDGDFVYASHFAGPGQTKSEVPTRHFTAGRPLSVLGTLTLEF